jgi:ABC-2 type transport system ATP-binding protein
MIELNQLVKHFGDVRAVDGISLVVPKGEFFCVLGPNAAGKTTTIKMLVGLIKPTSGSARVAGYDVQAQPLEARSRLSYVPDCRPADPAGGGGIGGPVQPRRMAPQADRGT